MARMPAPAAFQAAKWLSCPCTPPVSSIWRQKAMEHLAARCGGELIGLNEDPRRKEKGRRSGKGPLREDAPQPKTSSNTAANLHEGFTIQMGKVIQQP